MLGFGPLGSAPLSSISVLRDPALPALVLQAIVVRGARTEDGHLIYMAYRGVFRIAPELLQRIRQGEAVDPAEYYLRTTPVFETAAEKYGWLNQIVAVGVGIRTPTGLKYTVYTVL